MSLGPHIPEWVALRERLVELVALTRAHNAYVLDAWGNLWCSAHTAEWGDRPAVLDIAAAELRALDRPLARGGTIDRAASRSHGDCYLKSFAGVYVLAIRFSGAFDLPAARAVAEAALPRVEALVLALPPPDGPGSGTASGFGVA